MTFTTWFTFFFAACVIAISPGSGAVLSMSHGLNYGVKKTSSTIAGLQVGLLMILAIAGAGVGSILMASEVAFSIVKTIGALYLIYLGINQWRARVEVVKEEDTAQPAQSAIPDWRKRFLIGFLTNATNPKGIIFMVAVLPQFISHDAPLLPQLLILGVTMCAVDLVVMHSYAFAASTMQRYFSDPRWLKGQNRFFGGILMAIGTALFFVKRNPAN
ncbi:LysE family translocator [Undibacterium sp. SXout7W]|uniref:LysE family translocator n=1 Tax=Undibacterium sp. SXout7W TaxID=3413049 RepID=UPI003BF36406